MEVIQMLLAAGADPHQPKGTGESPIDLAESLSKRSVHTHPHLAPPLSMPSRDAIMALLRGAPPSLAPTAPDALPAAATPPLPIPAPAAGALPHMAPGL